MDGDDDDLGAGPIDSVVLPRKTTSPIINNNNSSRIGHEEEHPDDNKGIFVHATTEDQPVFENQTSVQDIVEEIKLLKNKNTIISQTMLDLSQFVMPNDRDDRNGIFIESYEAEKDSVNNSIMENPEGSSYIEENACQLCQLMSPIRTFMYMNIPKTKPQFERWEELYSRTPQEVCTYAAKTYNLLHFKKEIEEFKSLAYWDFQTIQNLIQFITHELHPSNVSVIVDVDDNPQMDCGGDTYSGNCHPLYIECTYVIIVYCKRSSCGNNHFVHYIFGLKEGICQIRNPAEAATVQEHLDQVFHLARKYCIIPGCKREKEIASWDAYLPIHAYKPQQVIQSESFYHSTKAPLQVFMATSHDSLLYQPEGDTGWSCGPFTVVKFLESLLQLERNGETKFFGCRAQFRLENCNWKQLDGMVVSSDHVGFPSKVPHVKNMDNFFGLGTV